MRPSFLATAFRPAKNLSRLLTRMGEKAPALGSRENSVTCEWGLLLCFACVQMDRARVACGRAFRGWGGSIWLLLY